MTYSCLFLKSKTKLSESLATDPLTINSMLLNEAYEDVNSRHLDESHDSIN